MLSLAQNDNTSIRAVARENTRAAAPPGGVSGHFWMGNPHCPGGKESADDDDATDGRGERSGARRRRRRPRRGLQNREAWPGAEPRCKAIWRSVSRAVRRYVVPFEYDDETIRVMGWTRSRGLRYSFDRGQKKYNPMTRLWFDGYCADTRSRTPPTPLLVPPPTPSPPRRRNNRLVFFPEI